MPPTFTLLILGDEILSGKRADKHMAKAIEILAARGLALTQVQYAGDDPERITALLAQAFAAARERGEVMFSCGGIGATPDDHTRQCAARALGVELALQPEAELLIIDRMRDVAREQGIELDVSRPENQHRLQMGMFPAGAGVIPNPYNKIPGFTCEAGPGAVHFLPGFPVMAWPMMEWLLDTRYRAFHRSRTQVEKSVIVLEGMEGMLTPLMQAIEAGHPAVKVFSLPSVDHPQYGRHIELGVKGEGEAVDKAYPELLAGLSPFGLKLGPELVR
jgi:molybdopterin-biosynthesis enzyme MoeA-like protein